MKQKYIHIKLPIILNIILVLPLFMLFNIILTQENIINNLSEIL